MNFDILLYIYIYISQPWVRVRASLHRVAQPWRGYHVGISIAAYTYTYTYIVYGRQATIHDSKYGTTHVLFASTYMAKQMKTMYYSLIQAFLGLFQPR